ncbi:tautomerase family protein [Nonomuraea jiangxiensis]|uniref:4-oxalocrotonate tautomerase n=1 Tax=Nonomuraea jiangxiensis TaxID=633440 RepID=A0A1G8A8Z2_9ACTN|nr:tautomerase family protein [Nonomuraea jiangxiensis]SDH16830.1 4-oxalocrotonate tautomerase [Nonomuraea jiangxiensis]
MPHITIQHFPLDLGPEQRRRLADTLTALVVEQFGTYEGAVSIALEPVEPGDWTATVYEPRIAGRPDELIKTPEYRS